MKICTENRKVKFPLFFSSSIQESISFKLVLTLLLLLFLHSEYLNTVRRVTPKNYAVGFDRMYVRKI